MNYLRCGLIVIGVVCGGLPVQAGEVAGGRSVSASISVSAARQVELIRMVRQDCGSCHGMTLKGGLGSPLLPGNLRDKPVDGLVATVMQGRPGTAMPPWQAIISEAEAEWIVARLLAGLPQE